MQINLKKLIWILPFISFILGYQLINIAFSPNIIMTPSLVGKQLSDAVKIASKHNLNLRIITEKIDFDLPANTILTQTPGDQEIKPNQSIFVVVSKKPVAKITPQLCGYTRQQVKEKLAKKHLKSKTYYLQSKSPKGQCFCQMPSANQELNEKKVLTYISSGTTPLVIMPNFIGMHYLEVNDFLKLNEIKVKTSYVENKHTNKNIIIDQKPASGSIININNLKTVHIYVRK